MSEHHRRLRRIEAQHIYRLAEEAGRPHGFTAEQVIAEARRFLPSPMPSNAPSGRRSMPSSRQRRRRRWIRFASGMPPLSSACRDADRLAASSI
jgi:hypothetical protein